MNGEGDWKAVWKKNIFWIVWFPSFISFSPSTVSKDDLFKNTDQSDFDTLHLYEIVSTPTSEYGLKHPNVQRVIHSNDLHFDLVINEEFFHESWLMFGYKFNAPVVTICEFLLELKIRVGKYSFFFCKIRCLWI